MAGRGLDPEYLSPRLTFQYELGSHNSSNAPGGVAVMANNAFDVATKIPISSGLAVEVRPALPAARPLTVFGTLRGV